VLGARHRAFHTGVCHGRGPFTRHHACLPFGVQPRTCNSLHRSLARLTSASAKVLRLTLRLPFKIRSPKYWAAKVPCQLSQYVSQRYLLERFSSYPFPCCGSLLLLPPPPPPPPPSLPSGIFSAVVYLAIACACHRSAGRLSLEPLSLAASPTPLTSCLRCKSCPAVFGPMNNVGHCCGGV